MMNKKKYRLLSIIDFCSLLAGKYSQQVDSATCPASWQALSNYTEYFFIVIISPRDIMPLDRGGNSGDMIDISYTIKGAFSVVKGSKMGKDLSVDLARQCGKSSAVTVVNIFLHHVYFSCWKHSRRD